MFWKIDINKNTEILNISHKLKQIYIETLLALLNPILAVRAKSDDNTYADAKRKKWLNNSLIPGLQN